MGSPPALPESFKVQWNRGTLTFDRLTAPVLIWQPQGDSIGVFARPDGMNLQIVFDTKTGRGTWSISGAAGQAAGTLVVEVVR
jgi:hypothetical protein